MIIGFLGFLTSAFAALMMGMSAYEKYQDLKNKEKKKDEND